MMSNVMSEEMSRYSSVEFTADSLLPRRTVVVESAHISGNGRLEIVTNYETLQYSVDWLRMNCQCKECYNFICLSYIGIMRDIVYDKPELSAVSVTSEGHVKCIYMDGHECEFGAQWLYNRRMTKEASKERNDYIQLYRPVAWPDPSEMVVKRATWSEVTETSSGLELFGDSMIKDGIFVITGAPRGEVSEEFANKTGLLRINNHYGSNWKVINDPSPVNHAYTNLELELHNDQTYLKSWPNIQLLHCMTQSKVGGENVMCDGIRAAYVLCDRNKEFYDILTTTRIQYSDLVAHKDKAQSFMYYSSPVINLDENGEPSFVRWNNAVRSGFFAGTTDEYEAFMDALREFYKILYECSITIKSNEGDILVFDNQRVMHGRLAYDASEQRELEGWYMEWDILLSKLRVSKIKEAKQEQVMP